jgi:hypothetical protein
MTLTKPLTKNLQQGAATTVYCAAHPEVEEVEYTRKFMHAIDFVVF